MARRPTNKTGIIKPRLDDPQLQRAFDAIIERLEVLDGLRGDSLDKAVTYRDLEDTGFTLGTGAGGTPTIVNTPGTGTGGGGAPVPQVGPPSGPPTSLAANETYLALLLTWVNPGFNLQHIEVYRADTDNLSLATLIGTTVSPQFVDYVGAEQTYYYWVRAVGTDGTFSAYNDTVGTEGTTGVDPGKILLDPDNFQLIDGVDVTNPFLVGTIDGDTAVGLQGQLIIDGTIRAQSIVAGTIGVDQLVSNEVSGIFASFGVMQGGRIRTAESPAFRVILEDQAATSFPLWYGSGSRSAANGLFYVTENGDVVVKGLLDAGIIKQSYFTPAGSNDSFRIATEYPNEYSGGAYSGKEAHLFPIRTVNQLGNPTVGSAHISTPFYSDEMLFYGPFHTNNTRYGRLGSYSELFWAQWSVTAWQNSINPISIDLEYQYDSEGWRPAPTMESELRVVGLNQEQTTSFSGLCTSRAAAFDELRFRIKVVPDTGGLAVASIFSISATIMSPNFGFADASVAARMD